MADDNKAAKTERPKYDPISEQEHRENVEHIAACLSHISDALHVQALCAVKQAAPEHMDSGSIEEALDELCRWHPQAPGPED